ncbi:MAG: hypothetical protein WC773_02820 [Patescibacteria group bacterium]|jgi:hypothetical protein
MERFSPESYRQSLADELKDTPKEERAGVLDEAKETPEYWDARKNVIAERQNVYEEVVDDGLGVLFKKKTLYHGSNIPNIQTMDAAEEDTIGSGAYFTSEATDAIGYAHRRSRRDAKSHPVIYEVNVENIKLLDLRKNENIEIIMPGYRKVLEQRLSDIGGIGSDNWGYAQNLAEAIEAIDNGDPVKKGLRTVTYYFTPLFTEYVESLGYDGLIATEGGEGDMDSGHDSFLIFHPEKAHVVQEHRVE